MPKRVSMKQLELFRHEKRGNVESRVKQLERRIAQAIRDGNLRKAEELAEEQRILLESQINN